MHFIHYSHCTKLIILLFVISVLIIGCNRDYFQKGNNFVLQPGDLLFQDLDCGPFCDAIEKVTTGYHGANFSHVGIVARDNNSNFVVIESLPDGVVATPLQSFLDRSLDANHQPKVVVGRLKQKYHNLIPFALNEVFALKGKPYDEVFAINNDAYYCSELIYEIFLRANNGKPIFKLQPMTFKNPDKGDTFPAWKEYFSELDIPIPESKPGINPGSISRSPVLTIVHAYGIPSGWEKRDPGSR